MTDGETPSGALGWRLGETTAPALPVERELRQTAGRSDGRSLAVAPLICLKDVVWLAALPPLTVLAWLLPLALCERLSGWVAHLSYAVRPGRYAHFARMFGELLPGHQDERAIAPLVRRAASLHHLERFLLLRLYRPVRWRPRITVTGREHVESALASGGGAILWVKTSSFSDIMAKAAFHQEGFAVSHLSRHTHGGFSTTRFGIGFLNWIRTRMECRYLARRVVIDPGQPKAALQQLAALLSQNELVSITAGAEAKRVTWVPVADGSLPLAGGAAKLALDTGAPLLPVFTERLPDGTFQVTVEASIQHPETAPDGAADDDRITRLLYRYGALMGVYLMRLPEQNHCLGLYLIGSARKRTASGQSRGR